MNPKAPELTDQWNDFALRSMDPYAMAKYEILLQWTGDLRGKSALIVGSGSGEYAALLAKAGAKVTAIDISEEYVGLTRKTAEKFKVNVDTFVARLETFKTDQKFDFVAATDVIEHIENDREAVQQLKSLIAPGGKLIITVPAMNFLFGYHDEVLGHFRRYDTGSIRKLISPTFRIERLRYYGLLLIPVALTVSRILRRPYSTKAFEASGKEKSIFGIVLRSVFQFEKQIRPPVGTSLLLIASPRSSI